MSGNELSNIHVFRKKKHINIGLIIFGVIFIYLIATVLMYLTNQPVSVYEVREGSILRDTAYTGFVIREEEVITSEASGYVNYFASEGSKVGAKTQVYSVSPEKLKFKESEADETQELTAEEQASLLIKTQAFSENFNEEQFSDVCTLRSDISSVLESKSRQSRQAQLEEMKEQIGDTLQIYKAKDDGIMQYYIDGYEGVTVDTLTKEMIQKDSYEKESLSNNQKIKAGSPVYKLITSDNWTIVIQLDSTTAKELAETKSIKVRFSKDNETAKASFSIKTTKDGTYGYLSFSSSMIRYAQERYLDIELILEDESGLKIPKSAVVEKDFYVVSEDYLTQGGDSNETGVLLSTGNDNAQFQKATVYYRDTENGLVYLDPKAFDKDVVLIKPDSTDTYRLDKTMSLKGVYNINKGYAVFKRIERLKTENDYVIVKKNSASGLSAYDHIALNAI